MIHKSIIINVLGLLLMILSAFMLLPLGASYYFDENTAFSFLGSSAITALIGLLAWSNTRNCDKQISKRDGFLIVALGWISISVFSSLPYILDGAIPHMSKAIFETVSGLTTTGATILNDIEVMPKAILIWRSLTQWLGGMGIIVLTVAILPLLGIGGVELFVAEAPGPTSDKIHPRIKETAKRLWFIYLGLTTTLIFLLAALGMHFFDAINHGLTTMATGGFSTKNESIAYYSNPSIHYVISFFMLFGGINYTVIYFAFKANFKRVWHSDELKTYLSLIAILITFVTFGIYTSSDLAWEPSFRQACFQVISIITTTGFITADYTSWSPFLSLMFFLMLFIGGCAGSTSGGIKIIRHLVFFKNAFLELKRLLHPKAIIRMKIDKNIVAPRILMHILVFLLLYLMLFVLGSLIMSCILSDFEQPLLSAIGVVATCLSNVGPSIAEFGPMDNFSTIPTSGQWILITLMIMGRLEIFTILVILTPYFWKKN